MNNQKGFSLVSAMIASAIVGVIILGFAQFMANQHESMRGVNQKFKSLILQQSLTRTFSDPVSCSCLMDPAKYGYQLQFDANAASVAATTGAEGPAMGLSVVFSGCDPTGATASTILVERGKYLGDDPLSGLYVYAMEVGDIKPTGTAGEYRGEVRVGFSHDPDGVAAGGGRLSANIAPVTAEVIFTADPSTGVTQSCAGADFANFFAGQTTTLQGQLNQDLTQQGSAIIEREKQDLDRDLGDKGNQLVAKVNDMIDSRLAFFVAERQRILASTPPGGDQGGNGDGSGNGGGGGNGDGGDGGADPGPEPFTGRPQILNVVTVAGGIVNVTVAFGTATGATGWEVKVNGQNKGSVAARRSAPSMEITINTRASSGETVAITVVGTDNNGQRSDESAPWSFTVN